MKQDINKGINYTVIIFLQTLSLILTISRRRIVIFIYLTSKCIILTNFGISGLV